MTDRWKDLYWVGPKHVGVSIQQICKWTSVKYQLLSSAVYRSWITSPVCWGPLHRFIHESIDFPYYVQYVLNLSTSTTKTYTTFVWHTTNSFNMNLQHINQRNQSFITPIFREHFLIFMNICVVNLSSLSQKYVPPNLVVAWCQTSTCSLKIYLHHLKKSN